MVAGHKGLQRLKEESRVARESMQQNLTFGASSFWDYRPFTRVIRGARAFLNTRDYIAINQLEGQGLPRVAAYVWVKNTPFMHTG